MSGDNDPQHRGVTATAKGLRDMKFPVVQTTMDGVAHKYPTGDYVTDLTINANSGVFATATDDSGGDPIWVKPSGDPLSADEANLLDAIGGGVFSAVFGVYALVFFALLMVS